RAPPAGGAGRRQVGAPLPRRSRRRRAAPEAGRYREAALRRGPAAPRADGGPGAEGAGARRPERPNPAANPSTIWGPARAADPDGVGVAEPGWGRARGHERAGLRRPLSPAPPRPVQSTPCEKGSARQSSTTAPESSQAAPALPRMPIALPQT